MAGDTDHYDIELGPQNAVDPRLFVPPSLRDMGSEPDIEKTHLRLRVGRRPLAYNLQELYLRGHRELPPNFEALMGYDIWLIVHSVSVIKEGGYQNVKKLGYRVCFPDKPRITVVELLPQTQFIKLVGASLSNELDLKLDGNVAMPVQLGELLDQVNFTISTAKLTFSNQVNLVGRLSFSVMSTTVQTGGEYDTTSEWIFTRHEKPLLGDQLMMQTVLVPKGRKRLNFQAQLFAQIKAFGVYFTRLRSDWIGLETAVG